MKHEALVKKLFDAFDTAWMPEQDRQKYFEEVAPVLDALIDDSIKAGVTEEMMLKVAKLSVRS